MNPRTNTYNENSNESQNLQRTNAKNGANLAISIDSAFVSGFSKLTTLFSFCTFMACGGLNFAKGSNLK